MNLEQNPDLLRQTLDNLEGMYPHDASPLWEAEAYFLQSFTLGVLNLWDEAYEKEHE